MKLAIIGSRNLNVDIEDYLTDDVTEIVSGGARGVDSCAALVASKRNVKLTEFKPNYSKYGRCAPLKRNDQIAEYADEALAVWDGTSKGTQYTVKAFQKLGKKVRVVIIK